MKTTDEPEDPWTGIADPVGDTADESADDAAGGAEAGDARQDPRERLADEARRLAEAVASRFGDVRERVVDPLLERHPEAAAHLTAAGSELMAAYRAFVADKERRWAARPAPAQRVDLDDEPESPADTFDSSGPSDSSESSGDGPAGNPRG